MNVTEFAEQVVFGTTMADKLLDPGRLTIATTSNRSSRGAKRLSQQVAELASPGRPPELRMQQRAGVTPPSVAHLENDQARGRLLHFLANHELLATELMALVLLKFPDAPHAFRQGVLVTLREEQLHTQLYIDRMRACGIEFGSFPVTGHFWRVVEPMQSPMDFVSRLSLTFEQANLDYSVHFAEVFRRIGDLDTSSILEQIYHDEIGHVRHGLEWFRKWKDPNESDWEAYQSRLTFPISPERARGPRGVFNRAGRRAAGLSDDFIDAVEVFRQSRGRTPTVRWFDPATEAELAGDLTPRESRRMHQLGTDLEPLMVPLAKCDDIVMVRRLPSRDFCRQLIAAGFDLPEFVLMDDRESLRSRKLYDLAPWAWTPKSHEVAKPLNKAVRLPPPKWRDENRDLFRKSWAAERLRQWLAEEPRCEFLATSETAGYAVSNIGDVAHALERMSRFGWKQAIIKADLATAGRGQRRLACGNGLNDRDTAWLRSLLASNTPAVIEPELNRVMDLSFLWHFAPSAEEPDFLGWTRPIVTDGRRFAGTRLGRSVAKFDPTLARFLLANRCETIEFVRHWLTERLTPEFREREFSGYFGVDALVAQDASGLSIKPIVELNPRLTMGHVALRLERRLAPGVSAEFRILSKSEWEATRNTITGQALETSADGRWTSGAVPLSEPDENAMLVPIVLVGCPGN